MYLLVKNIKQIKEAEIERNDFACIASTAGKDGGV